MFVREYAVASTRFTSGSLSLCNLSREDILDSVRRELWSATEVKYWSRPLTVTFRGEAGAVNTKHGDMKRSCIVLHVCVCVCVGKGICSGPRKEFFACFAKALARGDEKLFCISDNGQLR